MTSRRGRDNYSSAFAEFDDLVGGAPNANTNPYGNYGISSQSPRTQQHLNEDVRPPDAYDQAPGGYTSDAFDDGGYEQGDRRYDERNSQQQYYDDNEQHSDGEGDYFEGSRANISEMRDSDDPFNYQPADHVVSNADDRYDRDDIEMTAANPLHNDVLDADDGDPYGNDYVYHNPLGKPMKNPLKKGGDGFDVDNCCNYFSPQTLEKILLFCALGLSCYIGSLIRIGFLYYKIWKTETNYSIMYAQIIGCFIMGVMVCHRRVLYVNSRSRFHRVLYTALTSGLCGCITTFSGWSFECHKNFMLQWDLTAGNAYGTYNGGRLFEWFTCLVAGVAIPLVALRFGYFVASYMPYSDECLDEALEGAGLSPEEADGTVRELLPENNYIKETSVVFLYVVGTLLIIAIPAGHFENGLYITYTALFGHVGMFFRMYLARFNAIKKDFPIGTFVANTVGTWIVGIWLTLSRYAIPYYDTAIQALLFGLVTGLCGCMTTVSTFVAEIDILPPKASYWYAFLTNAAGQLGLLFLFSIHAYTLVPMNLARNPDVNVCVAASDLCDNYMFHVHCPAGYKVNTICTKETSYDTYEGLCQCGNYSDNGRTTALVVEGQLAANTTLNSFVRVWPTEIDEFSDSSQVIDYCHTFRNTCDNMMNVMHCPHHKRSVKGCGYKGLDEAVSRCTCGDVEMGDTVQNIIINALLHQRGNMFPYMGFLTQGSINFCVGFEDLCDIALDNVQCEIGKRHKVGCSQYGNYPVGNYSTYVGQCICGREEDGFNLAEGVSTSLYKQLMVPYVHESIHITTYAGGRWDVCYSYIEMCEAFLNKISCPANMRVVKSCGGRTDAYPYGALQSFDEKRCSCGRLHMSNQTNDMILDKLVAERYYSKYVVVPPSQAPYSLLVESDPFRQLLLPNNAEIPY